LRFKNQPKVISCAKWLHAFVRCFNPTSYYFILVLVLRDLLIGMTPVLRFT
jgi:hypothetical protein